MLYFNHELAKVEFLRGTLRGANDLLQLQLQRVVIIERHNRNDGQTTEATYKVRG
jgi:hypothetical protein